MIKTESLHAKWIQEASGKLSADRMLTEKVVWALWLLECLAFSSLPFIFKGGTALMLKLESTRRLSIDIDIVMPLREEGLAEALNKIAKQQGFIRVEEQRRETEPKIPKTHFKFFYKPLFQNALETYVLLDILFGNAGYQTIKTISIESPFVLSDGKATQIQVPSFEDLTGDKFTAFAPNTTGIPYQKSGQSASMEIIKQLYDLGYLFDQISDLETIRKTFAFIAKTELGYRNLDISINEILKVSFNVCNLVNEQISQQAAAALSSKKIDPDDIRETGLKLWLEPAVGMPNLIGRRVLVGEAAVAPRRSFGGRSRSDR